MKINNFQYDIVVKSLSNNKLCSCYNIVPLI
uniref:Uncharacterized protein n=1 Tax=Arundo donax TaxID=35708 RepID=A0A0A8YJR7_ARUDO